MATGGTLPGTTTADGDSTTTTTSNTTWTGKHPGAPGGDASSGTVGNQGTGSTSVTGGNKGDDATSDDKSSIGLPTLAEKRQAEYQELYNKLGKNDVIWSPSSKKMLNAWASDMAIISGEDYAAKTAVTPYIPPAKRKRNLPTFSQLMEDPYWMDFIEAEEEVYRGRATWGQTGGVVPGPKGSPQLTMLHGGEMVLPIHLGKGWKNSTRGGTSLRRYHENFGDFGGFGGDGGVGRMNLMNKPTTINIMTTESAAATIDTIERQQMMDEASFYNTV